MAVLMTVVVAGLIGADPAAAAPAPGQSPGIDISSYQHPTDQPIDWKAVRASGMKFVYIKATEPTRTGRSYNNPWFQRDWAGAGQVGMYRGAYHFAQPRLPLGTAEQDAQQFLNVTGMMGGPLDMPPVLDLETTGGLSAANLTTWTSRWLAYVTRATGKRPIIYSGWAFWKTALGDTTAFNGHQLWMARWQTSGPSPLPGGWQQWKIWQYGTTKVPGIRNAVDANVMCGTAPTYGAPAGCAGIPEKQKTSTPTTTTTKGAAKGTTTKKPSTTTNANGTVNLNVTPIASKRPVTTTTSKPRYYYTYKGVRYWDTSSSTANSSTTKYTAPATVKKKATPKAATASRR